jgi:hypothetical protein
MVADAVRAFADEVERRELEVEQAWSEAHARHRAILNELKAAKAGAPG